MLRGEIFLSNTVLTQTTSFVAYFKALGYAVICPSLDNILVHVPRDALWHNPKFLVFLDFLDF